MRRVMPLLICLMLGSVAGCAHTPPRQEPTVLTVRHLFTPCPHPTPLTANELASTAGTVDGDAPFDGPANVDALTARHQMIRTYVRLLEAALSCYDAQAAGGPDE